MRASSRALLHVGSLSLWDRQPSNAPPLLLSPAGLASRRGPHTKTHLGLCPETPYASVRPDRKVYDLPDLGLDDAYKVFILIRSLLGAKIKCAAGTFATSLYTREAFAARWPQIVPRNKLIFPVNHSLISPILMQNQPIFLQYCKFSIKKSEILTF